MSGHAAANRGGAPLPEAEASKQGGAPFARPRAGAGGRARKLRRLLVAKAALETLFVVVLAAGFFYLNLNPRLEGALTAADARRVEGWVAGARSTGEPLEVQLFIDGRFAASAVAEGEPPPGGSHAAGARRFAFELPPLGAGEHEARVYAVHVGGSGRRRTLHPVGAPARVPSERGGR